MWSELTLVITQYARPGGLSAPMFPSSQMWVAHYPQQGLSLLDEGFFLVLYKEAFS